MFLIPDKTRRSVAELLKTLQEFEEIFGKLIRNRKFIQKIVQKFNLEVGLLSSPGLAMSLRGFAKRSRREQGIASSRTPRNDRHFQRT